MGQTQTGRVTVVTETTTLQSMPGASFNSGGLTATNPKMSDQGQFFSQNQWMSSRVKATLIHTTDLDIIALRAKRNITVQFKADTGAKWIIPDAVPTEIGDLTNGEVEVTWEGSPAKPA